MGQKLSIADKHLHSEGVFGVSSAEAYQEVCSVFSKLCPRLVPEPLWGVSLAGLARMDPWLADDVLCGGSGCCRGVLEELHAWWFNSLPRRGVCEACGREGVVEVDEDWRYYVEGGRGVAVLAELRLLCSKCHLAKHQGFARASGRGVEALEHLARVNSVGVEVAEELVDEAFSIWERLSMVRDWRIELRRLPGLNSSAWGILERMLNDMVRMGYSFDGHWLWYEGSVDSGELREEAGRETEELLRRILGDSGIKMGGAEAIELVKTSGELRRKLVREIEIELAEAGIQVLPRELEAALSMMRFTKTTLEGSRRFYCNTTTTGKWMIFLGKKVRGKFFAEAIRRLRRKNLDHKAKTVGVRGEEGEKPVIIYVPSLLALDMVREVALTIIEVRDEMGIKKPLMFKPDTFTRAGIYSNTTRGMRSYIYVIK